MATESTTHSDVAVDGADGADQLQELVTKIRNIMNDFHNKPANVHESVNEYRCMLQTFLSRMLDEDPSLTLSNDDHLSQECYDHFLDNLLEESCITLMSIKCKTLPSQPNSEHLIRDCIEILIRISVSLLSNESSKRTSTGIAILHRVMDVSCSFWRHFGQDWVWCAQMLCIPFIVNCDTASPRRDPFAS